jgi:glucose-fructose oxidoreductase
MKNTTAAARAKRTRAHTIGAGRANGAKRAASRSADGTNGSARTKRGARANAKARANAEGRPTGERRSSSDRSRKVRYAVVGLGHIAQVAVLPAFQHARRNCELAALVSDDAAKLRALGRKYGVAELRGYDEYDDLLRSGAIDAVYIALPNDMHRDFTLRAVRSGVHVLCEKPLAVTARDAEEMVEAAQRYGVKLMTAYRLHYERGNLEAIEIVRSGRIGEPRFFHSLFGMQVTDEDNIRLEPERGGGPLLDLGVYCVNAARYLFRDEPLEVLARHGNNGEPRFRGVPEMTTALMRFPGDRFASFTCSFGSADVSSYRIVGTEGDLELDPAYEYAGALEMRVKVGGRTRTRTFEKRDQFAPELVRFAECVLEDREPEPSGREGLADLRVLDALQASAEKGGKPVTVRAVQRRTRPTMAQELRAPPVEKPAEIRVASPSED